MTSLFYTFLTACYVFLVLIVSAVLLKKGIVHEEGARKFVHIFVSFSIFAIIFLIDNPILRLLGPIAFIFINAVIGIRTHSRVMGLVCYPVSMLFLILLMNEGFLAPSSVISGILAMGLGDGCAGLVGMRWGRIRIGSKTLEGTLSMLLITFIVFILFSNSSWYISLLSACIVSIVEVVTPHGLDNLSVPIVAAILPEVL